jgi:hypothetical protein
MTLSSLDLIKQKDSGHLDNFKIGTNANTDGLVNCLRQPKQLLNQIEKSMRETTTSLIILCLP